MKIKSCKSTDKRELYDFGDLNIWWTLSYNCNFNCPYCWNDNKEEQISNKSIEKSLKFINSLVEKRKISLTLYGGEPTIIPNFFSILKQLEKCYNLKLITNCSFNLKFAKKLIQYSKMIISCSYHSNVSIEHYINIVKILASKHIIECRVMIADSITPNLLLDKLINLKKDFDIIITPKLIYHPDFKITKKTLEILNNFNFNKGEQITLEYEDGTKEITNSTKMLLDGKFYFKFYKCYCGINNLAIDSNSDLYYCDTYKKEKHRKIEVYKEEPIICDKDFCDCHLYIKKEKTIEIKQSTDTYEFLND